MIRKLVIAATLAASFASIAPLASAAVYVREAPPPPRTEAAPAARRGYVWSEGHWEWQNRKHKWVRGAWVKERRGHNYVQPAWVERDGRWTLTRGTWRRGDRDGDGVPNRQDRAPNNPNRS